ncbi:bifunctional diaminohydroxyphosphoribosylaminopyrimidine deaminase/5-amino-6-(5-phosphoribosylamino)uracil reductase [[Haemophilus] ducreyi]|uniref:Riboflavin biosynthesis protein RibD n=2 Tax=Haemophilus ducreyi TaxID=730 RepID=Q7VM47_HAEDU|nr:bifunctional diaminohydroxyphosphoribosylaminopyrimidine deaminase/5-amino-6-(5-phosphoribosylamino)uracil reductase RibD [[Haemophilus] ducreyi]AAP96016.1 riboflavin-specific deaminase [[Haemophilus] ducreyi 35000HP]AKO31008.1 riboflavin biosynthesis protein RibD [[Haemophilus] ducreyi]AKO32452.1 riboflavin biosynthesis protein RibD [[Haemophilus] ducreyi]AKO33903.1 riboflavin biosynthesis protein RibD [[Haemophilus] ducreyi]AKO35350.1 riboflavin biosynthesis protein RibD [[Haemophilus] du
MTDVDYMARAIALAEQARGWTNPNPLVGCVIVKNDQIIAEGYHQKVGEWHAERNAILNCQQDLTGATAYVTLEPCCHHGRTPPCTDLLIERGINKVFVGSRDPNPLVTGKGIKQLQAAGIEVITDFMREACDQLNPIFFHYMQTTSPYVLLKYAMTADGKIATATGESKWISGELARQNVQITRHQYSAIMVGVGTVLADNPMLNSRMPNAKQPIRVVCDSHLRTPLACQLVQTARQYPTIIATASTDSTKIAQLKAFGVQIIQCKVANKQVDLVDLLAKLGAMQIDSVLLEGGSTLNFSALKAGVVNRIHCYIAPKLLGGSTAKSPIGGAGILQLAEAVNLTLKSTQYIGDDILLDYDVSSSQKLAS